MAGEVILVRKVFMDSKSMKTFLMSMTSSHFFHIYIAKRNFKNRLPNEIVYTRKLYFGILGLQIFFCSVCNKPLKTAQFFHLVSETSDLYNRILAPLACTRCKQRVNIYLIRWHIISAEILSHASNITSVSSTMELNCRQWRITFRATTPHMFSIVFTLKDNVGQGNHSIFIFLHSSQNQTVCTAALSCIKRKSFSGHQAQDKQMVVISFLATRSTISCSVCCQQCNVLFRSN